MRTLTILFAGILVAATLSCDSDRATQPRAVVPDDVLGLWSCLDFEDEILRVEVDPAHQGYRGITVAATDSCAVGRTTLEFSYSIADTVFIGRHIWCNADTTFWGDPGMVRIEQHDRGHLFVKYLDHVWSYGWHYERVDE